MERRSFLRLFGIGAAALAASEAIPFGRVWSFPSKIVIPEAPSLAHLSTVWYDKAAIQALEGNFGIIHPYVAMDLMNDPIVEELGLFQYA